MGYLAFGEATHDIITFNLPPGWSTPAVKAALCIGLFLTFPPMMIPVYEILERSLSKKVGFHGFHTRSAPRATSSCCTSQPMERCVLQAVIRCTRMYMRMCSALDKKSAV